MFSGCDTKLEFGNQQARPLLQSYGSYINLASKYLNLKVLHEPKLTTCNVYESVKHILLLVALYQSFPPKFHKLQSQLPPPPIQIIKPLRTNTKIPTWNQLSNGGTCI